MTAQSPAIRDNSFLLEEAYNQEAGVVQHISAFLAPRSGGEWLYAFTQEWPLGGPRHQLGFTVPVLQLAAITRVGDVALNYRYQLAGPDGRVAVAPRLSLFLPTGDFEQRLGAGAFGLQLNIPASIAFGSRLVTHWNAGAAVTPSAKVQGGDEATIRFLNLGASAIWLLRPSVNLVLEALWVRGEEVIGSGTTATREEFFVSPGIRWAHNFASGLQIVPGVAFPVGVGTSRGDDAVFLYLSLEHPF